MQGLNTQEQEAEARWVRRAIESLSPSRNPKGVSLEQKFAVDVEVAMDRVEKYRELSVELSQNFGEEWVKDPLAFVDPKIVLRSFNQNAFGKKFAFSREIIKEIVRSPDIVPTELNRLIEELQRRSGNAV